MQQSLLFVPQHFPPGFTYQEEFISKSEESELLAEIRQLDLHPVVIRDVPSKRLVKHFGYGYSFEKRKLTDPIPLPQFILPLRSKVARLIKVRDEKLAEVLFTEYPVGAAISWHADAEPFDVVVGISLLNSCAMKLRTLSQKNRKLLSVDLAPRSVYVLDGEVRSTWQHHIPPTKNLRYSVTFRTLR